MKHTIFLAAALLATALLAQQAARNPAAPNAPLPPMRPKVLGVAHLAVYVKDLDKTRKFYESFLGFAEPFTLPEKDGTGVRIVFVKVNEHQYFEIFNEADRGEGQLNHISFYTDNADQMAKALTMQYNRARQSQITTELSEIMGGVEAMKSR